LIGTPPFVFLRTKHCRLRKAGAPSFSIHEYVDADGVICLKIEQGFVRRADPVDAALNRLIARSQSL
jgi:hypothetical protein